MAARAIRRIVGWPPTILNDPEVQREGEHHLEAIDEGIAELEVGDHDPRADEVAPVGTAEGERAAHPENLRVPASGEGGDRPGGEDVAVAQIHVVAPVDE